ncbi:hypothetical protein JIG36_24950 [Actinoplanes sp. LDG1-06]|uniref:Uncharacterized protein n=1 Tax=Paractinoplanes ovalisporus TaxID=2810368 RepID=A0ABS2AG60_9ACTN|nr:hypothetical protein [Actinoplanes ovalisporus]MBM2618812.1 hypothetical protein [Actinoplanes ovalisporus]
MATISLRGALLRSLPALLLLLTLGFAAPQQIAVPIAAGVTHSISSPTASATAGSTADTPDDIVSPDAASARTPGVPVADRTRNLSAQVTAGIHGSRAPPFALA